MSQAGHALSGAVADALPTLEALLAHRAPLGEATAAEIEAAVAAIRTRLARTELAVVVVGEKKAGKSTFLNAILGDRVLGAAVRECTGTVTTIRRGETADYRATLTNGRVETFSSKMPPLEELGGASASAAAYRHHLFLEDLHALTDMDRRGGEVVSLDLTYPARHLPEGLLIVDTPGANTDHAENQARAWRAIRELADGCVLLSDLQQVMSRSTRDFLQELRTIVPHVTLVLTKADRALENAFDDAEEQLEEARQIGVKRFAKEMGRDPAEVLALVVAAEPVLKANAPDSPETRHFQAEVDRLFARLQDEKAIVLGARAARTLADCTRGILEAQDRAEAHYADRIARMEAQRIQAPEAFKQERVTAARRVALETVVTAVEGAAHGFRLAIARLETRWTLAIAATTSQDELKAKLPEWARQHGQALDDLAADARAAFERQLGEVLNGLLLQAHDELRERYRLAQGGNVTVAALPLELPMPMVGDFGVGLSAGLAGTVDTFEQDVATLQAGGAAAGAVIGSMIAPGLGTAVGAVLGSMAGKLFGLDMLKEDCQAQVKKGLAEAEQAVAARLREARPAYEAAFLRRYEEALGTAIERFHGAIAALLAAEAQKLAGARAELAHLVGSREAIARHEAAIGERLAVAVRDSAGLAALDR